MAFKEMSDEMKEKLERLQSAMRTVGEKELLWIAEAAKWDLVRDIREQEVDLLRYRDLGEDFPVYLRMLGKDTERDRKGWAAKTIESLRTLHKQMELVEAFLAVVRQSVAEDFAVDVLDYLGQRDTKSVAKKVGNPEKEGT